MKKPMKCSFVNMIKIIATIGISKDNMAFAMLYLKINLF